MRPAINAASGAANGAANGGNGARQLKRLAARIDALSLRERAIMFVAALVCLMVAAESLWLEPARTAHRILSDAVLRQESELRTLRSNVDTALSLQGTGDPKMVLRAQIAATGTRLDEVNGELIRDTAALGDASSLPGVLEYVLRKHEHLVLIHMGTALPAGTGADIAGALAAAPPAVAAPAHALLAQVGPLQGVNRRTLEMTVAGPYADLLDYVQALEQAQPTLRWGTMRLNALTSPPQLTLHVDVLEIPR